MWFLQKFAVSNRSQLFFVSIQNDRNVSTFAAMADWLCCLACTIKVPCSNFGATRHRMTLDKSLTAVFLGSPGRCILIMCDIHRPLWLVSVHGECKWLSGETLRPADLLSRATAGNRCRKNIGLSKLSPDSTLYAKAGYIYPLNFKNKRCLLSILI
jgi:hypothetical protein